MKNAKIPWQTVVAVVSLGFTSIVSQIVLLREFLSVFFGNELIIGIILANWMILTGAGAYAGKFMERSARSAPVARLALILGAILPIVTIAGLRMLRNIVFPVGTMIGILPSAAGACIILLPYCFISGFVFTLLVRCIADQSDSGVIARVYAWEAVGSTIGGLLFSIILVFLLKAIQVLELAALVMTAAAFLQTGFSGNSAYRWLSVALFVVLLGALVFGNLDDRTKKALFPNQDVLSYRDTPYGNITVTGTGGQKNFFENNALLYSSNDPATAEEQVHYAMVQHPDPRTVLLISGGYSGTAPEILKYHVERIDYVELNPALIEVAKNFTPALTSRGIHIIIEDARLYVKHCRAKYDVVLMNTPDPATAQTNRYYTEEFYRDVKNILNPGGVISLSLLAEADYYGGEARSLNSVILNTVRTAFANVAVVPGSTKNYFLASDSPLGIDIARRIDQRGINTIFVNRYYIDDGDIHRRSNQILANIDERAPINRDFMPVAYDRQLAYWLSYFNLNYWAIIGVCGAMALFVIGRLNAVSFGIFAVGFAGSAVELLLVIAFQVLYGYVYQMLGVIVTIFMAGLAIGSFVRPRLFRAPSMKNFSAIQFSIAVYVLLLPICLLTIQRHAGEPFLLQGAFVLLTFVISLLVGLEFSLASRLQPGSVTAVTSTIYGVDLFGSALGALIAGTFLIPKIGVVNVSYGLAILVGIAGIISLMNRRKYAA